jgi:glycerophosphoryl diester phosphodiesterase
MTLKLDEVMGTVAAQKRLLIDVKGDYSPNGIEAFARAIVAAIAKHDALDWASVCGQYWPVLDRVREIAPQIEVRYSIEKLNQWEKFLTLLERDDLVPRVCIEHRFLDEERARYIKEHGIEIYCWTVDDPAEAARLVEGGVDGIISNDLELLAGLGLEPAA